MAMHGQGLLALTAFSGWWSPTGGSETIRAEELLEQIKSAEEATILDVRSLGEFRAGHIPGALHIPLKEIESRASEIPGDEGDPIVVYCAIGPRAVWALKTLRSSGRNELVLLEGHFSRWKKNGYPVEV